MKKLLALFTAVCLIFGLWGCNAIQHQQPSPSIPPVSTPTENTDSATEPIDVHTSMYGVVLIPTKETFSADDGTTLFSLNLQNIQVMLQDQSLEKRIISNLQTRMASITSDAALIETQAQLDYPDSEFWSEYFIDVSYTPTRLDQAVLSLFSNSFYYSGGPHPSLITDSVTYDLQTGDVIFLDDILAPECTSDTLYQLILKSLANQADDLYYDYADALGDRFTGELHSIQDWYFSREGLCFHFAPYDIAPYSSGTIIAELPYSNLVGVLKEEYIPSEPSTATGSMYVETYIEDDSERFTYIAQVSLVENGNEVLLYPDATVTDLRIEIGTQDSDNNQYLSNAIIFTANAMNVGDAIRLVADLNDQDTVLRLIYRSGGQEYSAFITYDEVGDSFLLTNN